MPSSFAKPRRVLRSPPFLIEDDTWAEHLVEVKVRFLPALSIPPASLMHHVLLQRRVVGLPLGLLSKNQGLPKPAQMVLLGGSGERKAVEESEEQEQLESRWRDLCSDVVVSERQDALRVLHPSFTVVEYYRRVRAKQRCALMEHLRGYFLDGVFGEPAPTERAERDADVGELPAAASEPALGFHELPTVYQRFLSAPATSPAFLLPAEACLLEHVQHRRQRCLSTLDGALSALEQEQEELCSGIDKTLRAMLTKAADLKERLDALHGLCLERLRGSEGPKA